MRAEAAKARGETLPPPQFAYYLFRFPDDARGQWGVQEFDYHTTEFITIARFDSRQLAEEYQFLKNRMA
jgi:hypothetical protein